MLIRGAVLVLCVCGIACGSRTTPTPALRVDIAAIDRLVQEAQQQLHLPGVSLAIMQERTLVLAKGYGLADRERAIPATPQTIYPVGSISKQVTAAAVMKLVESKQLVLDRPVTAYVPELQLASGTPPTIRQLLDQTAGLVAWDDLPEAQPFLDDKPQAAQFDLARIVSRLGDVPPRFMPGTWWSYSNSNYALLARAIENVTGAPYDLYTARALHEPLDLRSTGECASGKIASAANRATGYEWIENAYVVRPLTPAKGRAFVGAGGLCSSAVDLAYWMRALVDKRAVTADSFRQMTTPATVTAGFKPPYGFGLSLLPLAGQRAIWHMGVMAGFVSVVAYLPAHDLIVVAIANSRHTWLQSLAKKVTRQLIGAAEPILADLPIPTAERARSIGNYDDGMFRFRIFEQGEQLFADIPPLGPPVRLRFQGGHEFGTEEPQAFRFRFEPGEGQVTRVDWEWGELRAFARRL